MILRLVSFIEYFHSGLITLLANAPSTKRLVLQDSVPLPSNIYVKVFSVTDILHAALFSALILGVIALIVFQMLKIKNMRLSLNAMNARWNFISHEMGLSLLDMNLKDRRVFYSSEWKEGLNFTKSDIGDSVDEWIARIHPDDITNSIHGHVIDSSIPDYLSGEYRVKHNDSSYKWVRSFGRVIERDEAGVPVRFVGFSYDVSKTKEIERALDESRSLIRTQFENSNEMIFIIGKDNSIEMVSKSVGEYSIEDLPFDRLPAEMKVKSNSLILKCFETGEKQETEFLSDESNVLDVRYIPVKKGKEINHVMIIASDISAQRKIEEKERVMQEQIIHADRIMSLGLLVSGVAHEINNPNQYILSNLRFLDDAWKSIIPVLEEYYDEHGEFLVGGLPFTQARTEVKERGNMVFAGSQKIALIVDELKSFARKDVKNELSELFINDAVSSAIELTMGLLRKSTNNFTVDYGTDIPPVSANKSRIEQVAVNLIQNACQSLSDTSKTVAVHTGCTDDGNVFFTITDQGCGMSRELQKNISIPFYTTKRDSGGTGLGLYVSRNIIQTYGGSLEFISEEGKGTAVTVLIPRSKV